MILSQTVDQDNNRLTDALIILLLPIEPAFSAPVRLMWLTITRETDRYVA